MKASANQIAKRYVIALLEATAKNDVRAKIEKDLAQLRAIYHGSELFQRLLINPLLTREQQGKIIEPVLKAIGADKVTGQFVALLIGRKRLPLLPVIADQFIAEVARARGEVKAELVSAVALKPADIKNVTERLTKVFGKKVMLETRQDASLLGGVVVNVGSTQLDSSLSGKMRRLQNKLKAA